VCGLELPLSPMSERLILKWARAYRRQHGTWPKCQDSGDKCWELIRLCVGALGAFSAEHRCHGCSTGRIIVEPIADRAASHALVSP